MSQVQPGDNGMPYLVLPAVVDLTTAPELKLNLQQALILAEGLEIDAGNVQRITSPCLQMLVSAARGFAEAGGPALRFSKTSEAFLETVATLSLGPTLGMT